MVVKSWFFHQRRAHEDRFVALVFPHMRQLYRVAFRLTGKAQEAEDLLQDLLVGLLPRVAELEAVERLGPWLAKVMYRRYVDLFRRRKASPLDESISVDAEENAGLADAAVWRGQGEGPADFSQLDLQRSLTHALQSIPSGLREVVLLHDVEGYTASEVAGILALQVGTVKSRLHRARKKLQRLLAAEVTTLSRVC